MENTKKDILRKIGWDFSVIKVPLFTNEDGEIKETPFYSIVNESNHYHIASTRSQYTIMQNSELYDIIEKGIESFNNVHIKDGCSFKFGSSVMMSLEIDEVVDINLDNVKRYIVVVNSHDSTARTKIFVGLKNQETGVLQFKLIRKGLTHTESIKDKVRQMPTLMKLAMVELGNMIERYRLLATKKATNDNVEALVSFLLNVDLSMKDEEYEKFYSTRKKNMVLELMTSISNEISRKGMIMLSLLNGVDFWLTHTKSFPNRKNGKVESLLIGTNGRMSIKALSFIENIL